MGGIFKGIAGGAIAGLVSGFIPSTIPGASGIPALAAGYIMKDNVLKTIGAYTIGQSLTRNLGLFGGNGGNGNFLS